MPTEVPAEETLASEALAAGQARGGARSGRAEETGVLRMLCANVCSFGMGSELRALSVAKLSKMGDHRVTSSTS